ncbi:MAG: hypothetical protein LUE29_09555 [Lachnospiraceae bacterium]|nr:hypothetical protein [Lachnospiraceae bacterium]
MAEIVMEDYKSNSFKSKGAIEKPEVKQEKKVDKVISGDVKVRKKNGLQKVADAFIAEDINSVKNYIFKDVLIPHIQKTVMDVMYNGLDMMFNGISGKRSNSSPGSRVSYRDYYDRDKKPRPAPVNERAAFDYGQWTFDNRGDAEIILECLDDMISRYRRATVLDLYDAAGVATDNFTANKYGWTDISSAKVVRVQDGYSLRMPRPMPLD